MITRILLVLLVLPGLAPAQGTFPPPSGPAVPVMKSLTQIEPRTAIQSLAGDFTSEHVITKSGSYYLTGNITLAYNANAITVTTGVSDVTIDLNGYTIESTTASAGSGTAIACNSSKRINVRNGNIKSGSVVTADTITGKGFASGINAYLSEITIRGVNVTGVAGSGIRCDQTALVENCNVSHCDYGIYITGTARHCIVTNCVTDAIDSDVVDACQGSAYVSGINCTTAINSTGTATSNIGLNASAATNCTGISDSNFGIFSTTATNCTGTSNSSFGLYAGITTNCTGTSTSYVGLLGTTATNCTGTSDSDIGLKVTTATNCTGTSTSGIGLQATNATNCIGTTSASASAIGLNVASTATNCRGEAGGGTAYALRAYIAIGCTYSGGLLGATKKFNM